MPCNKIVQSVHRFAFDKTGFLPEAATACLTPATSLKQTRSNRWVSLPARFFLPFVFVLAGAAASAQQEDTAYTRVITQRAEKITQTLGLKQKKEQQATAILTSQFRYISTASDNHKATVAGLKKQYAEDKTAQTAAIRQAEADRDSLLRLQHAAFLKQLNKVMRKEQVEQVKNGMTYNLVNVTYDAYVDMIPSLKPDEKQQIRDWLVEARELAMDAGSSDGKHAVFGKYKGRINNYLSKQGYDSQKERASWEARIKARKEAAGNAQ